MLRIVFQTVSAGPVPAFAKATAGLAEALLRAGGCRRRSAYDRRMAIRIVRLGSPRASGEGLRLGTVRRPPRGVRKEDLASRDFYDVWLPGVAPSEDLLKQGKRAVDDDARWKAFARA